MSDPSFTWLEICREAWDAPTGPRFLQCYGGPFDNQFLEDQPSQEYIVFMNGFRLRGEYVPGGFSDGAGYLEWFEPELGIGLYGTDVPE